MSCSRQHLLKSIPYQHSLVSESFVCSFHDDQTVVLLSQANKVISNILNNRCIEPCFLNSLLKAQTTTMQPSIPVCAIMGSLTRHLLFFVLTIPSSIASADTQLTICSSEWLFDNEQWKTSPQCLSIFDISDHSCYYVTANEGDSCKVCEQSQMVFTRCCDWPLLSTGGRRWSVVQNVHWWVLPNTKQGNSRGPLRALALQH